MQITGTTALITGAASGLGAATAALLAARGASVIGIDLPGAIEKTTDSDGIRYVAVDVTREADVAAALEHVDPATPLRIVVNCAGIGPGRRTLSSKGPHELDLFSKVIEVNLVGTFNVLRLSSAVIAEQSADDDGQRGVIINTASIAAFEGQIGQVAYAASKGGVVGMTIPAARDLARYGIRVNTIAPGLVDTPLLASAGPEVNASLAAGVPFPHRLARPEEYAQLVCMVIEHDYLNGETIRMDGALRMAPQ